jgi:hypothetical protein
MLKLVPFYGVPGILTPEFSEFFNQVRLAIWGNRGYPYFLNYIIM